MTAGSALGHDNNAPELSPTKDDDPDGTKLISVADPLERAATFLRPLATLASDNIKVWIAIYDVAVRRSELLRLSITRQTDLPHVMISEKYLQAIKSLLKARSLDPENPELHVRTVDLRQRGTIY